VARDTGYAASNRRYPMVELRSLAYFMTACRSGSFALAAADLGIAVSTLSTTMKALGEDLGLTLFRRINNSLYPTAAARGLMRGAEPLLTAERFARRLIAASSKTRLKHLTVDVGLSYTIGGISTALRRAIDSMGAERADIFVDTVWTDEKDLPHIGALAEGWPSSERNRLTIALADAGQRKSKHTTTLLTDDWVFACRLPAGTASPPSAAELIAGRIVVPLLSPPLIEQADRYFSQHKITGIRFLNDHPGDLPRVIDDYPDAALFVPRSLVSPRLGLSNVAVVRPRKPPSMEIVTRAIEPNAVTTLFIRHLKRALRDDNASPVERPVISLRQIHYFNMVHRLRRVSAAARGANISQPALSEQLHKLEASLGGALFERHGDGVIPTAKGDRFAGMSALIESGFRRLSDGDAGATPPQSRRIAVGILPSVNQHGFLVNRITEAILDVQARHPALKFVIQEAPNGTLQDWVMRGLVGVAIVETVLPHMPRLPLGSSEALAVIAHAKHRLLPSGPVTLADLTRLKLALPTNRFGLRQLLGGTRSEDPAHSGDRFTADGGRDSGATAGLHRAATVRGRTGDRLGRSGRAPDRRSRDIEAIVRDLFGRANAERARARTGQFLAPKIIGTRQCGLKTRRSIGCRLSFARQRFIECRDRSIDNRSTGRDRFTAGPFFRRVALAGTAWHEHHGGRTDPAHERRIMTGTARQIGMAETEVACALAQRGAQFRVARHRRAVGQGFKRRALDARGDRMRQALAIDGLDEAFGQRRIGGSCIDDQPATSGHDIRRRRFDGEDTDGGDEIIRGFGGEPLGQPAH
jgi:LysR family nitrogen assimilation transcriptional regulator